MTWRPGAWRWLSILAGVTAAGCTSPAAVRSLAEAPPGAFLRPTASIDSEHPAVVRKAQELVAGAAGERERAVRLHDFVRDEVRFGFESAFYDMKASEVLEARRGFCIPKTTLLVALLRAAGIPARVRVVDLGSKVLDGVLSTGGDYVDHSYTEVFLEGRWLRLDSYTVDAPLYARARERLLREGKHVGYGVHVNGGVEWDGTREAFIQYVDDGTVPGYVGRERGIHEDIHAYYRNTPDARHPRTLPLRLFFPLVVGEANQKLEALRRP